MFFFKKINVLLITVAFFLSFAVSSADGQRGRYWRGDNGNHHGWYKRKKWKKRKRYVSYRRYYPAYRYRRVYRTYPRYYAYPRYYTYPRYRYYAPRRGGLVNINLRF